MPLLIAIISLGAVAALLIVSFERRGGDVAPAPSEAALPAGGANDGAAPGSNPAASPRPGTAALEEIAARLHALGVTQPLPALEKMDAVFADNIRQHASHALRLHREDPAAATAFMESRMRFEEEKLAARSWRARLRESAAQGGGTPSEVTFVAMLRGIPDRYFAAMLDESLRSYPEKPLARLALDALKAREEPFRLAALARIAENAQLARPARESAAETLAPSLDVEFTRAALEEIDWSFLVGEHLDQTVRDGK